MLYLSLKLNQKCRFTIMLTLMLLIELCEVLYEGSFQVWGKESDEMRWDEVWKKDQAWGCSCHPKKYPRGTSVKAWGCPRGTPSSSAKIRSSFKTLYFYCFMYYAFFLERLCFWFQFYVILFAAINGWTPTNFFWRRHTLFFIDKNTLVFTLIVQRVFSFSRTAFSFHFSS
jgi:hypothetical protein